MNKLQQEREQAIHLRRSGWSSSQVAAELGRSPEWVRKWWRRYQAEGWSGAGARSRAPHRHGRRLGAAVHQAVKKARSELEAEAEGGAGLKYIGARAVRTRLKAWCMEPLPSVRTIERMLRTAHMTRPRVRQAPVNDPRLCPSRSHQLCQVDHIPRYLTGGQQVYCFNTIEVASRYPTGQVKSDRRAATAADFLPAACLANGGHPWLHAGG